MNQTINIVKLIEENPNTKLSKPYQGKLLNKLKDNFSTDEQQLFISSFYCYLNYKSDDFVIDLDDIWNWLGFARKTNAKNVLEKQFNKETDYLVLPSARENLQGGRPSEKIMLNIRTFKKMCLKANTSKANEIHEYYLKLEETLHEVIDEESNELRLQLEIIEKQNQELNFKISLKNANFRKGKSLYAGSNSVDKENFKVGIANDVNIRLGTLNTSTSTDFVVWKTWITRFSKEIEDAVKKNYADYRIHVERKEFYKMTVYDEIIAYIDKLVAIFNETDRYEEIDGELLLDKIKVDKKVCTKCLKYLTIYEFYLRNDNDNPDIPKDITEFDEKQQFYKQKYRSHCKSCHYEHTKEVRTQVKLNPNFSKKECNTCETLYPFDLYYKNVDESLFDDCIQCYKSTNNLDKVKQCSFCKNIKEFDKFQIDISHSDNVRSQCKECINEKAKEYRKNKENKTVECEFCKKIIYSINEMKRHQETKSCLKAQGKDVEYVKKTGMSKNILLFNPKTNEIMKEFESIADASKELDISRKNVSKYCNNEDIFGDYKWTFKK